MKNKKLFAILTLVCFMMTLMPVAAFAAVDAVESYVYTDDTNASVDVSTAAPYDYADICFDFDPASTTSEVYVWFVKDGSNVASEATTVVKDASNIDINAAVNGVFKIDNPTDGDKYGFAFKNTGKYTVHAALTDPLAKYNVSGGFSTKAEAFKNAENELSNTGSDRKVIEVTSSSNSSHYGIAATFTGGSLTANGTSDSHLHYLDGVEYSGAAISANNVTQEEFEVTFYDTAGKAVKGETVTFETNSANIELNKEKATTDQLGKVKFKVAGVRDGNYRVYVKCGSYEATFLIQVGATGAQDIKVVKSPEAPFDVTSTLGNKIQFTFSDANSNAVTNAIARSNGAQAAFNSNTNWSNASIGVADARQYVAIVSQPSASKAENKDFKLTADTKNNYRANLDYVGTKDLAEGTYEIKVVLDNGKYTTVKFEVKEFQTPVSLNLKYNADAVELDSYVEIDTLEWVDANGVTKDAIGKVDLAATGYAVNNFVTQDGSALSHYEDASGNIYASAGAGRTPVYYSAGTVLTKNDEKYVGSKITVIAVDDRYNLTAKAELTVADEASSLAFDTKTLALDVNNKVGVSVVDSNGNKVALNRSNTKDATISYVVLDKPEGSKVSVTTDGSDNNILEEGTFKMNVTANKIGNVTIQAVAKVTYNKLTGSNNTQQNVVKYYTGTQIFAVGKDSVGQVVVMSIGSSEVIVNDKKVAIDAVPMIKNDRTFVPFRALAEAFGAEVAYDEATQAITAELNGVKVVMTIGSATFTVNGAEKTMDVAPFINGSRTMVPVRFAAEAFGIKVIPTYDQNGGTADILFNL